MDKSATIKDDPRSRRYIARTLAAQVTEVASAAAYVRLGKEEFMSLAGDSYDDAEEEIEYAQEQASKATDPGGNSSNATEPTDQPSR